MTEHQTGAILRVYVGEGDHFNGKPLHEAVVEAALESGLAGATVLRGILGYGAHHRIHSSRILRLSGELPLVIQIIDREDKLRAFLPRLDEMIAEGMASIEPAEVIFYRATGDPG